MRRSVAVLLLALPTLLGCGAHRYSAPTELSPLAHRGTRALIGATVTLGAKEVGIKPSLAILLGTVGQVGASKALIAIRHPDWIGPWTPGDALCDVWTSAAVVPLVIGRQMGKERFHWRAAVVAAGAWGLGMLATDQLCIP